MSSEAESRVDDLWSEISFLAYHLHWDLDTLLDLEHADRRRIITEVSRMNEETWLRLARERAASR